MNNGFTFNGVHSGAFFIVNGKRRAIHAPITTKLITVPNLPGAYDAGNEIGVLNIEVDVTITAKTAAERRQLTRNISNWLYTEEIKPLVFDDEPDKTYYAKLTGDTGLGSESVENITLTFVCPDPFAYGKELQVDFPSDSVVIENPGTAEADPIFELTAKEKTTFAMVATGEDGEKYNMIGIPADDDVEVVDTRASVLFENGSTIDTWQTATLEMVDSHFIDSLDGVMGTDGAGIRPSSWGTPRQKQRGAGVYKELPSPIQDFEIESTFDVISSREIENWRMGIMFWDENWNNLGLIGLKDNSRNYRRRVPLARYGPYRGSGRGSGYLIGDSDRIDDAREITLFYLRVKREGNTFDFYIGEWQNQQHVRNWQGTYRDVNNQYSGKLRYVSLYITSYQDRPLPTRARMNSVEVFELSQTTVDQTPYILYEGDTVIFDHNNSDILVNGESRMDLKDFGGRFFKLMKGYNTITTMPDGAFDTKVRFRPRYR